MCLTPDFTRTERMKKRRDKNPNAFCFRYKVLELDIENWNIVGLQSPYVKKYKWKVGFNLAQGTSSGYRILAGSIHTGSNKREIKSRCLHTYPTRVLVQVKCYLKDFIASDTENYEAWKQVYLTKKEYNRAIKLAKKQIK